MKLKSFESGIKIAVLIRLLKNNNVFFNYVNLGFLVVR